MACDSNLGVVGLELLSSVNIVCTHCLVWTYLADQAFLRCVGICQTSASFFMPRALYCSLVRPVSLHQAAARALGLAEAGELSWPQCIVYFAEMENTGSRSFAL